MRPTALSLLACALGCAAEPDGFEDDQMVDATGCSEASCESGLRIALVSNVFTPGGYTLSSVADGVESVCGFVIGGQEDGCGPQGPCLLEDDCGAVASLSFPPHSVVVQVGPGAPEVVEVVVLRGGSEIAGSTFVPTYQTFAPAGPGCEPVCEVASAQLDIP